jgi:quercetin dioxygenase-like cupin family protein
MLRGVKSIKVNAEELAQILVAARRNSLDLGRTDLGHRISAAMRSACPHPGEIQKFMTVLLKPGQSIDAHSHKRHAVIWYPDSGHLRYIAPGELHNVATVKVERLSVAMLVSVVVNGETHTAQS